MRDLASNTIHIGFDLDGTLIDHAANKQAAAAQYGIVLTLAQTVSGVFQSHIPEGIKPAVEHAVYDDPQAGQRAILMPGAIRFLQCAASRRLPCTLISRRRNPDGAWAMLRHHGLSPDYFQEGNTFFVPDKPSKNTRAIQAGITHYIDDEPDVLGHLTAVPHKFLFDPYDVWPDSAAYARVCSWAELESLI